MNAEVIKALSQLSVGAICALGLLASLWVLHQQNQVLGALLERQTVALERIARVYSGE